MARNPLRVVAASLLTAAWLLASTDALAHTGAGGMGGFLAGVAHPVLGLDHVVAMVAVGLWGAQLGQPAVWVLPVAFPLVMALGGLLGIAGAEIPAVEVGIAASGVVLGLMVALAARPPLWVAGVLVALFAIFHGHAHGTELPDQADPLAYAAGFVLATGALHALGIAIGLVNRWPAGAWAVRAGGGAIAAAGIYFLAPGMA